MTIFDDFSKISQNRELRKVCQSSRIKNDRAYLSIAYDKCMVTLAISITLKIAYMSPDRESSLTLFKNRNFRKNRKNLENWEIFQKRSILHF